MFAKAFEIALIRSELSCTVTDLPGSTCQGDVSYHESSLFWTQLPCPPRIQSRGWNYLSYFSGLSILYKFGWISLQPYFGQNQSIVELPPPLVLEAATSSIPPTPPFFDYGGRFLMNHIGFTKPFKSNSVQFLCYESSY